MGNEATYAMRSSTDITREIRKAFVVPVGSANLAALGGSSRTASEIIQAVRTFDRNNSNRGDWETILRPILKNGSDVRTLLALF